MIQSKRLMVYLLCLIVLITGLFGYSRNFDLTGHFGGVNWTSAASDDLVIMGEGAGLRILDISDPSTPVSLSKLVLPGIVWSVSVSGDYAYVAAGKAGLCIVNIADPANPVISSTISLSGSAYDLEVSGDNVFIAAGEAGMWIVNVSDPANPFRAYHYSLQGLTRGLFLDNNRIYLASTQGIVIVNVTDPYAPFLVGTWSSLVQTFDVSVSGNYAYVAAGAVGFWILDISNPASPSEVESLLMSGNLVTDVQVSGNYAYVADYGRGLFLVADVSNPQNVHYPVSIPASTAFGITLANKSAFLSSEQRGLDIINISNPLSPAPLGRYHSAGASRDVFVSDSTMYIAEDEGGLRILDITNPSDPFSLSVYDTPGSAYGVYQTGIYAYVADLDGGLRVIDVSDTGNPSETGAMTTAVSSAQRVEVYGDYAYLADRERGMKIIDIQNPAAPFETYEYLVASSVYNTALTQNTAYVAHGESGLRVLDISNPYSPTEKGVFDTSGAARDVSVSNSRAFVAESDSGISLLDVTDPANPKELNRLDFSGVTQSLALDDDMIYVAAGKEGVKAVQTSPYSALSEAGSYVAADDALSVFSNDDMTCLSCGDAGTYILKFDKEALMRPVLVDISPGGDVWGSESSGTPPFKTPQRWGYTGFSYKPEEGYNVLQGDFNGDGLHDLIQFTPYGDVWVSLNKGLYFDSPTRWAWLGFNYDETAGYLPLAGDFNGDGKTDLVQVTMYGDVWVALAGDDSFQSPSRWGWLGFRFDRGASDQPGYLPMAGDFNGDGKTDLAQLTPYGDVWISLSGGADFHAPSRWSWLGFQYNPQKGVWPMTGDFNGDGKTDMLQLTTYSDVWVTLSDGASFQDPSNWGALGFHYDEAAGLYPVAGDVNGDEATDLIQITPGGDPWVAESEGTSFDDPLHWGWIGFLWSRQNHYLPMFLNSK